MESRENVRITNSRKSTEKSILDIYFKSPNTFNGIFIGFIFGILTLKIGVLKTFMVFIPVCIGFIVGQLFDGNKFMVALLRKIIKIK